MCDGNQEFSYISSWGSLMFRPFISSGILSISFNVKPLLDSLFIRSLIYRIYKRKVKANSYLNHQNSYHQSYDRHDPLDQPTIRF